MSEGFPGWPENWVRDRQDAFRHALEGFDHARPVLVASHNDADGLSAAAVLARSLEQAGHRVRVRILGRGENPWSDAFRTELQGDGSTEGLPGGLIVSDLGLRREAILPTLPTVVIDHHVPTGPAEAPPGMTEITGHGLEPTPTSSLLAYWCAGAITEADDLLWLAAIGIIGDLEEKSGFAELDAARARYGITALRDAVSLINAPRRASAGDASPALRLLMRAEDPREITKGEDADTAALRAAKEEVKQALEDARRAPPRVQGKVALIRMHTGCQVHPLVAQAWRGRLSDKIVIAANTGYRPGWVHFAARSATGEDLVEFLRTVRPRDADENYGNGHAQATGGALRTEGWNEFMDKLGFGEAMKLPVGEAAA
ncbi:single-stranded-DNA-specific exonuclease RecJ [Roseomonas elaeocarpi]|uniref:Phosphoesterase n=1 Tax=Roseomonas elaeocarpi TaxID=907779 RepID=A0ABV6JPP9_9PROT